MSIENKIQELRGELKKIDLSENYLEIFEEISKDAVLFHKFKKTSMIQNVILFISIQIHLEKYILELQEIILNLGWMMVRGTKVRKNFI